jgi:arylsulfatase A-like enzyme
MFGYAHLNRPEGPNVILITIDTLRADHLGSYGYERDTSPNIDSLAEKGILFENAFSQAPWTLPSMASMHTSLYPTQIGILKFGYQINDKLLMIAEYMKNNFYNTSAVVSNIVAGKLLGFGQGFDLFEETFNSYDGGSDSKIITDKAIRIIRNNKDNRFFLWVHYMDPHDYYIRHSEFNYGSEYAGSLPSKVNTRYLNKNKDSLDINDLSYVKDLYDGEISYTDKYIGELINSLRELGIEENTIIILTADHGEGFMERGTFGHSQNLYQELINVPLVIYNPLEPKLSGKRVTNNVEVRYIAKTIFELTNLNNSYIEGYNLLDIDHENSSDGIVYSEQGETHLKAVLVNDWKLISNSEDNIFELYNLKEDPNERSNQFTSNREDITQVRDMLTAKLLDLNNLKTTEIKKIKLEEEDIKKLKALGYLQ